MAEQVKDPVPASETTAETKQEKVSEKDAPSGRIPKKLLDLVGRPRRDKHGNVVRRTVKRRGEEIEEVVRDPISEDEVLAWREYPDRVVVVTTDGQKFDAPK